MTFSNNRPPVLTDRRQFLSRLLIVGAGMPLATIHPGVLSTVLAEPPPVKEGFSTDMSSAPAKTSLEDYRNKMRYFNKSHPDDVWVTPEEFKLLQQAKKRLDGVKNTVGHGNFYLISFDEALKIAQTYSQVGGPFTQPEVNFLEDLFHRPAAEYGFYGLKPVGNLTHSVNRKEIVKVQGTNNYLFRGDAEKLYQRMRADVGNHLVLTSGVRNVIKQFHLFLSKSCKNQGQPFKGIAIFSATGLFLSQCERF